jgi:hypothetical protein
MLDTLQFRGGIRNVRYKPMVRKDNLPVQMLYNWDIHATTRFGILEQNQSRVGYSTWVSPKRTRSYPFSRLYNIYHLPKKITIIPIIKDEGLQGDCDRINYITLSWMNLANVFIILGYYDDAMINLRHPDKITQQKLNGSHIQQKLQQIFDYQQTTLHWNIDHFARDFDTVFAHAVESYARIEQKTGVSMHLADKHYQVLKTYQIDGKFQLDLFKENSLRNSFLASQRELQTQHQLESLSDGAKAYFSITNWLGGEYHLTADEIIFESDNRVIIQESKNNSHSKLPTLADIQDGLFKLMLFANMQELYLDGRQINFITRLKLTANCLGQMILPHDTLTTIHEFANKNALSKGQRLLLEKLYAESSHNPPLEILISGRS